MKVPEEEKKREALRRMRAFEIFDEAVRAFEKDGAVMVSEPPLGGLFHLTEEQRNLVSAFERENNALVYLVVRCYSTIGTMDSFLYVSDYEDEWEYDRSDVRDGYAMTYTHNYDMPDCSEFGSIAVKKRGGGLIRVS